MRTLLDAGPLVALVNRRDAFHDWTSDAMARLSVPLWTCEPVLAEAAHLSGRPAEITDMVAAGSLRIGLAVEGEAEALSRLLRRYARRMDLADACIVRMSELFPDSQVFTLDRNDFSVYRRNGRRTIPLLAPPAR